MKSVPAKFNAFFLCALVTAVFSVAVQAQNGQGEADAKAAMKADKSGTMS